MDREEEFTTNFPKKYPILMRDTNPFRSPSVWLTESREDPLLGGPSQTDHKISLDNFSKEDEMSEFEHMKRELAKLKITLSKMETVGSQGQMTPQQVTKGLIRPKDVEILRLEELSSVEGIASKVSFFRRISSTSEQEFERVQACLTRLDRELRLFVESSLSINHATTLWDIQTLLEREFAIPKNLPDSIDKLINTDIYTLDRDPREYAHRFKVRYGILCTAYQTKGLPNLAKVLKEAMLRGLDMTAKMQLGSVLMEEFGEEDFLKRLEALRLGRQMSGRVCGAIQSKPNLPSCRYCNGKANHLWKDCPRKPKPGSCFDCLNQGHRVGDPACPRNSQA